MCQHIADGLVQRERVGFFWADDTDNPTPDAWCAACDERLRQAGGVWNDQSEAQLGVRLMCGHCYRPAKIFHLGGNPWS